MLNGSWFVISNHQLSATPPVQLMTTNMAAYLDPLICDPAVTTYRKLLINNVQLAYLLHCNHSSSEIFMEIFH